MEVYLQYINPPSKHGDKFENVDDFKALIVYWSQLLHEDLIDTYFPMKNLNDLQDFLGMVFTKIDYPFLIWIDDLKFPIGHVFFEGYYGKAAQVHFGLLRDVWGEKGVLIGLQVLKILRGIKTKNGQRFLKTIVGIIPNRSRLAIRYAKKVGFKEIALIPCGAMKNGEVVDGVMVMKVLNELPTCL